MKLFFILFLTFLLVLLGGLNCSHTRVPLIDPPGGKSFWALAISQDKVIPYVVPALFAGNSKSIEVYVEIESAALIAQQTIDEMIMTFENQIAPIEHRLFTSPLDVDSNGKVTVLLLDIRDGNNINEFIAGYFDPWNHFSDEIVYNATKNTTGLRSNEKDMLYFDTNPSKIGSRASLATLAHEYQHLLHFSFDYRYSEQLEEKWVDEGLAELASDLSGLGPQTQRLYDYATTSANSLIKWENRLADYSSSYVYFRMLADAYDCSSMSCPILSTIFQNPQTGIKGVDTAIRHIDPGFVNSTACISTSGLSHEAFHCSYRQLWANLLNYNSLEVVIGSSSAVTKNVDSRFQHQAQHSPALPPFSTLTTLEFDSLRYGYFKKNSGDTPQLSIASCPGTCNVSYFTLLYNTGTGNNYVIYNHTENTAAIVSRTPVVAQVQGESQTTQLPSAGLIDFQSNYKHFDVPFHDDDFQRLKSFQ